LLGAVATIIQLPKVTTSMLWWISIFHIFRLTKQV